MPVGYLPASAPHTLQGLAPGADGVNQTLKAMVKFARAGQHSMPVISLARAIINKALPMNGSARAPGAQMTALQHFVRDCVRYVRDPVGREMVQTPERTLQIGTGDCDDKSVLLASLLGSVGFVTRFVALGIRSELPTHVLVETRIGTRWVPCETIVAGVEPGWYPANVTRRMVAYV